MTTLNSRLTEILELAESFKLRADDAGRLSKQIPQLVEALKLAIEQRDSQIADVYQRMGMDMPKTATEACNAELEAILRRV